MIIIFLFLLIFIIIIYYLVYLFIPRIEFNVNSINSYNYDNLHLEKNTIKSFVSFRSYIHYTRFIYLNTNLMDKKKLYDFLNENKIPYPKIYYYSSNNFKIRKIINNLINENKCFVVKPTNLSEKLNCIVYKNGINMLNGNTVDLDIFNDYKINDNILTESLTLKMNKPGIIVQESLHVSDIINEWKIFCCWGHVIFAMWRQNHLYDIGLIDSEFNFKSCLPFFDTPKLPKFKNEIYTIAKKLSRSYPFIRIDFLFNYDKFVVNEIEFCPSGFYGNQNEKMLMECIKKGYNINSNNLDYLLEIKSYLYFILNRFNCLLI